MKAEKESHKRVEKREGRVKRAESMVSEGLEKELKKVYEGLQRPEKN